MSEDNQQVCKNKSCDTKRRFAWRSYFKLLEEYETMCDKMSSMSRRILQLEGECKEVSLPEHFKNELLESSKCLDCIVCYDTMTKQTFTLTKCFHKICKNCISKLDKCPVCRKKL
jgi:hypothetical protein